MNHLLLHVHVQVLETSGRIVARVKRTDICKAFVMKLGIWEVPWSFLL